MFTRVLMASDGSESALKAAQTAAETARRFGIPLTVLYVFSVPTTLATFGSDQMGAVNPQMIEDWAEEMMQTIADRTGRRIEETPSRSEPNEATQRKRSCAWLRRRDAI
jgi:nucleotide-binding universal stress UspA family protein